MSRFLAVLTVCVLLWVGLPGCASMYAGELARDALGKCRDVAAIDYRGGRLHESASTFINCRIAPAQERPWSP
jgi:hypothetical protein